MLMLMGSPLQCYTNRDQEFSDWGDRDRCGGCLALGSLRGYHPLLVYMMDLHADSIRWQAGGMENCVAQVNRLAVRMPLPVGLEQGNYCGLRAYPRINLPSKQRFRPISVKRANKKMLIYFSKLRFFGFPIYRPCLELPVLRADFFKDKV